MLSSIEVRPTECDFAFLGPIILIIPRELVLHIGYFCNKERILDENSNRCVTSYPIWNLYRACSSFSWLAEYEYLCVEFFGIGRRIVSRDITGKFNGMMYHQDRRKLLGYYGSSRPPEGYNYSKHYNGYRIDFNKRYFESGCKRSSNCKIDKCITCTQLDAIQKELFEKDTDVADIFNDGNIYQTYVIIRPRRPVLHFKFDYSTYNT